MQVSFIIPLYNCLPLTQAMLASLKATIPAHLTHEIILVDDGSTDGTRNWLKTLPPPLRVVLNESNLGYAGANNRGAALARGELLVLLNNDLLLTRGWLEALLAAHASVQPRAGCIGNVQLDARTGEVDHTGIFINLKGKPEHDRMLPPWWRRRSRTACPVPAVTGACLLIERALWKELGGFDEGYVNGCEDIDLCLRALATGRVNAIAWRSAIRHHISRSPGRKRRDEENTYRLTQRWRNEIERLGLLTWTRLYLERWWPKPDLCPDRRALVQAWLHSLRVRRRLPDIAPREMQCAVALELDRWQTMFGSAPAPQTTPAEVSAPFVVL